MLMYEKLSMMASFNFENPDAIWLPIEPDFLQNLTPGRYILRKRKETDTRFYAVLNAIQENSTGRGLQLFVNDLREFYFMDGPPTWESLTTSEPELVHPGKQISRSLQCECLIYNVHLWKTVEMGRGNFQGNWKYEEEEVIKQLNVVSEAIRKEYDCFFMEQDGDVRKELLGFYLACEAVPNPNKGKKAAPKRSADEKKDDNENGQNCKKKKSTETEGPVVD